MPVVIVAAPVASPATATAAAAVPLPPPPPPDVVADPSAAPLPPAALAAAWRDIATRRLARAAAATDAPDDDAITVTIRVTDACGPEVRLQRTFRRSDSLARIMDFIQVTLPLGMAGKHLLALAPARAVVVDWADYDLRAVRTPADVAAAAAAADAPCGNPRADATLDATFAGAAAVTLILRSNKITADLAASRTPAV